MSTQRDRYNKGLPRTYANKKSKGKDDKVIFDTHTTFIDDDGNEYADVEYDNYKDIMYPNHNSVSNTELYDDYDNDTKLTNSDKLKLNGILSNFWNFGAKNKTKWWDRFNGFDTELNKIYSNKKNNKPLNFLLDSIKIDDNLTPLLYSVNKAMLDILNNTYKSSDKYNDKWNYKQGKGNTNASVGMHFPLAALYASKKNEYKAPLVYIDEDVNGKKSFERYDVNEYSLNDHVSKLPQQARSYFKHFNMGAIPDTTQALYKQRGEIRELLSGKAWEIPKETYNAILATANAKPMANKYTENIDEEEELIEKQPTKQSNKSDDDNDNIVEEEEEEGELIVDKSAGLPPAKQTNNEQSEDKQHDKSAGLPPANVSTNNEEQEEFVQEIIDKLDSKQDEQTKPTASNSIDSELAKEIKRLRQLILSGERTNEQLMKTADSQLDRQGIIDKYTLLVNGLSGRNDTFNTTDELSNALKQFDANDSDEQKVNLSERFTNALSGYAINQRKDELQNMLLHDRFTIPEMFLNKFTADLESDLTSSDEFRTTLDELKQTNPDAYKQTINQMALKMWKYYKQLGESDKKNLSTVNYSTLYRALRDLKGKHREQKMKEAFDKIHVSNNTNTIYSNQPDKSKPYQSQQPTKLSKLVMKNSKLNKNMNNMTRNTFTPIAYVTDTV